ncbi:MAG: type II secretion system F family protein [bacterium]|nr:type II secretion system F family protein [bacterium]
MENEIHTGTISLGAKDKMALLDNLSTMLTAGISILEAVDSLIEDSKGSQLKLLTVLRKDLTQGKHVYHALARFPHVFDHVTVNIVKASEEAGTLDVTLKDIKNHIQKEMEFTDKIRSAMIYPVLIFMVFVGVLLMILVVVMPKMATVFTRMKVELPLPTRIMIFSSEFILNNSIALIIGVIVGIILLIILFKKKRSVVTGVLFSLPLISGLIKQIDIARFTRNMFLLLSAGLTLTNALELCADVVWRADMKRLILHAQKMVLSGRRVSEGFRDKKGFIPMIVVRLIEAGEKTGSLDRSMQDISEHMDYEVSRTLATLTALLEPIMLIFIGVVVGGMMVSIIAPIYSLIGSVNGG